MIKSYPMQQDPRLQFLNQCLEYKKSDTINNQDIKDTLNQLPEHFLAEFEYNGTYLSLQKIDSNTFCTTSVTDEGEQVSTTLAAAMLRQVLREKNLKMHASIPN